MAQFHFRREPFPPINSTPLLPVLCFIIPRLLSKFYNHPDCKLVCLVNQRGLNQVSYVDKLMSSKEKASILPNLVFPSFRGCGSDL